MSDSVPASTNDSGSAGAQRLGSLGYQPALDGVRFVGVTAFVLGHAGVMTDQPQLIPFGWWMAVDLFFVMSGYLITTLLLRERGRYGRVSRKAFYLRRVTRLYPLVIAVVAISIVQRLTRPDDIATPSWLFIFSTAAYVNNFEQLTHPSDLFNAWGPLWSLAIEEQFYILWPTVLIVLLGRSFNLIRPLVVVAVVAVAIWVYRTWSWLSVTSNDPDFAQLADAWRTFYFSTFHRPDGLMIGCAAALILAMPRSAWTRGIIRFAHRFRYLTIIGILSIVVAASYGNAGWQVCWGLSVFNLLGALLMIELIEHPETRLTRVLSLRPMLWVGRRSYGVYVMHLFILMIFINTLGLTSLPWIFTATAVIMVVAGLSYRYYENPIRRWGYRQSKRILSTEPAPDG